MKKTNCDITKEVNIVKTKIRVNQANMFSTIFKKNSAFKKAQKIKKGNGGWADVRDHQLCLAISNGTASESTLQLLTL